MCLWMAFESKGRGEGRPRSLTVILTVIAAKAGMTVRGSQMVTNSSTQRQEQHWIQASDEACA
ncbi:hypothetical protein Y882_18620 [Dyella japonica DSM 16301]|uniref:Uncharacterized protein n=1 Tax=Dyella japonica DSM 16301 TaxID=1440762 RepID=A0A0G9GX54_9GAMM|nr:hypothetical protein Y882_18620 [Dyella japonica DSM 16301]